MKATEKQFQYFKSCCEGYIDLFSLRNWEVCYKLQALDGNRSECWWKLSGYLATIYLNAEWNIKVTPLNNKELRRVALHEVLHLLLARISTNARARYIGQDELKEGEEEAIRRLTHIILEMRGKDNS